mgnify:CR=1 FL=1
MYIDSGLCRYHIVNLPSEIERELFVLYGNAASVEPDTSQWYDYHLDVKHTSLLRRVLRPQVVIDVEGQLPFNPVSPDKLFARSRDEIQFQDNFNMHISRPCPAERWLFL